MALRAVVDDFVHALIRTQHVDSPAGNIFTGGLEEALFDLQIGKITNPDYRVGSPAAGMLFIYYIRPSSKYLMPTPIDRRPPAPRISPDQVCRVASSTETKQWHLGRRCPLACYQPRPPMDFPALEPKLVCLAYLAVTTTVFNSIFIVDGISGGLPYGGVHTGHRPCNIARYGRELASVA